MSLENTINEMISEGKVDKDIQAVADVVKSGKGMFDLKEPLKKAGYKAEYHSSPVPVWMIKKGSKVIVIANKKYAEDADLVVGAFAVGYM